MLLGTRFPGSTTICRYGWEDHHYLPWGKFLAWESLLWERSPYYHGFIWLLQYCLIMREILIKRIITRIKSHYDHKLSHCFAIAALCWCSSFPPPIRIASCVSNMKSSNKLSKLLFDIQYKYPSNDRQTNKKTGGNEIQIKYSYHPNKYISYQLNWGFFQIVKYACGILFV